MKTYITGRQLRLVGKAYEIRWQLKALLECSPDPRRPLAESLEDLMRKPGVFPSRRPQAADPARDCRIIPFPAQA